MRERGHKIHQELQKKSVPVEKNTQYLNSTDRYPLSCLMKTLNTNSQPTSNQKRKSRKDVSTSGESQAPEPTKLSRNMESSMMNSSRVI